jgi:hypothetical protein
MVGFILEIVITSYYILKTILSAQQQITLKELQHLSFSPETHSNKVMRTRVCNTILLSLPA